MKKVLSLMIACAIMAVSLFIPVHADEAYSLVVDAAYLLSDAQAAELEQTLQMYSQKHGMDFVVLTVETLDGESPQEYADDFYDLCGYGQGVGADGALLLHCPESRDWHISTSGAAIGVFSDAVIEEIGGVITSYLAKEDFFGAYMAFAAECDAANTHAPLAWYWIVVALGIGFVLAWVVVASMKGQLNTVRSKAHADDYMRTDSMNLTVNRDIFLFRHVDRRPKPKQNAGSTTHRSSSGRTHGGGGGKY